MWSFSVLIFLGYSCASDQHVLEPALSRQEHKGSPGCGTGISIWPAPCLWRRQKRFHRHSWKAFLAPQAGFWFGVKPFPQQDVENKVELKEVSLSTSAPWHKSLTHCQRCCVASQNWGLVAAAVCRPLQGVCPETLVLHAQNSRFSLHSLLARWQTGNHILDPSNIHLCSFTGSQAPAEFLVSASNVLPCEVF